MHQYIGARYVPKFYENSLDPTSCLWEANVTYEPLTMVVLANQHAYISKKTVPNTIGSPADNAEYWLETGNTNAYIADLQDRMDAAESDISGLQTDMSAAQADIVALDPLEKFRGKTVCVIGDSISDYNVLANNWVKLLSDKLAEYNCTLINESDAGRSFASLQADMQGGTVSIPTADYYILFIGTNYADTWGWTTGYYPLIPAVTYVNNAIKTANPNAKYFFISPMKKYIAGTSTLTNPLCIMRSFLEKQFTEYGYTVLSGYNMGEMSAASYTNYTIDGIHPNETYAHIMYDYILDGIISERSNISVPATTSRNQYGIITTTSEVRMRYNDDLSIDIDIVASSYSPSANQWIDLFDMPTMMDSVQYPTTYYFNTGFCQFRNYNGKLQVFFFTVPQTSQWEAHLKYQYPYNINS